MKKIILSIIALVFVSYQTPACAELITIGHKHDLSEQSQEFLTDLFKTLDSKIDRLDESVTRADANFDKIADFISPERISRLVSQAGIVLTASATAVLATAILYTALKNEINKHYDKTLTVTQKKMGWQSITSIGLSSSFLAASIATILYSGQLASNC